MELDWNGNRVAPAFISQIIFVGEGGGKPNLLNQGDCYE